MIRRDLPNRDELTDIGIDVKSKKKDNGDIEAELHKRGWSKNFPYNDPTLRKHLGYRFVRWLVGEWIQVGKRTTRKKGYGWALVMGVIMFITILISAADGYAGSLDILALIIGSLSGVLFEYFTYQRVDVNFVEIRKKGQRYPVAYHYDAAGNKEIDWETADADTVTVYTKGIEALSGIYGHNIRAQQSRNGEPTYLTLATLGNAVWGDEKFAELSPRELLFLSEPDSIFPTAMSEALKSLKKASEKHDISDEDVEEIRELITDTYDLIRKWQDNVSRIKEMSGKKYIRVRRNKSTDAFLLAWPERYRQLREKEEEIMRMIETKPESILDPVNKAIRIATEFGDIGASILEAREAGIKIGRAQAIQALKPNEHLTEYIANSQIKEYVEGATETQAAVKEFSLRKKMEEMFNGDEEEEYTE
jgi:hypothetical protein